MFLTEKEIEEIVMHNRRGTMEDVQSLLMTNIVRETDKRIMHQIIEMIERRADIYTEEEPEHYALKEIAILIRAKTKSKR